MGYFLQPAFIKSGTSDYLYDLQLLVALDLQLSIELLPLVVAIDACRIEHEIAAAILPNDGWMNKAMRYK